MRKVELNMKEQTKYEIVKRFVDNNCTNYKNLSILLESSLKTAYNYVKKYKTHGKLAFKHGNNNRKPKNTKSQDFCNKILDIFDKIDCDINFKHFQVILKRDYHISVSYNFLYNLLTKHETISPKAQKETRKKFRQNIKFKLSKHLPLSKTEQTIVSDHLLDDIDAHPRKERSKYFGELIQMDASQHLWFGNTKTHLHAAIDDATGKLIGAYFD